MSFLFSVKSIAFLLFVFSVVFQEWQHLICNSIVLQMFQILHKALHYRPLLFHHTPLSSAGRDLPTSPRRFLSPTTYESQTSHQVLNNLIRLTCYHIRFHRVVAAVCLNLMS